MAETGDLVFTPEFDTSDIEKQAKQIARTLSRVMNDKSGSPQIERMQKQLRELYDWQKRLEETRISLGVPETDPTYLNELAKIEEKYKQIAIQYTDFQKKAQKNAVGNSMQSLREGLAGVLRLFPQISGHLSNAFNKLKGLVKIPNISGRLKSATSSLRRILIMVGGIVLGARGLYTIVNKLRSSVLAGFKDVYNQDKEFKTQMDTIKQKILDIQVALAESLMPVIQLALPYIKQLLDWIMSLLGTLKRFISTVTGIQAYTKAIKGLGGAAQNANKQLSKLDELNNLSSGGGNGLTPLESSIGNPDKIKDWFTFTRNIIDELEKALRAIPWEDVYKKAEKFGQQVGLVLDAIFKPSFWNASGETVAGVMNTLLHFSNALGNALWFDEIGKSIFQGVTGVLDKFDFNLLKSTIWVWADGLWTVIKTVLTERGENGETLAERLVRMLTEQLSTIDWGRIFALVQDIGSTLAGTLNQLISPELASEAGKTLGNSLMTIVKFAIAFFGNGGLDWGNLGDTIANAINGFFESFDGKETAKAINSFFNGVITAVKQIIKTLNWSEIKKDIKDLIANTDWKSVLSVLSVVVLPELFAILKDVFIAVWGLVKVPLLNFLQTVVWPEIVDFFAVIFGNPMGFFNTTVLPFIETVGAAISAALGGYLIGNGLGESFALLSGDMELAQEYEDMSLLSLLGIDMDLWEESWFETFDMFNLDKLILNIEDGIDRIKKIIGDPKKFWSALLTGDENWAEDVGNAVEAARIVFEAKLTEIGTLLGNKVTEAYTNINEKIGTWWNDKVVPFFGFEKWENIFATPKKAAKQILDEAIEYWTQTVPKWIDEKVAPLFTEQFWLEKLKGFSSAFSSTFKGLVNTAIGWLNKLIEALETLLTGGIGGVLNNLGSKLNKYLEGEQIPTFSGISLPRIPALASGTVIPPSMGEFIAKLGDNNSQTEIVSPLDTMKQAFLDVMSESGGFGGEMHIHLDVDGRELTEIVVQQNEMYKKSTGKSLLA